MEPEVNQYGGSHMVMTNVMKDVKKKYVNIDTRFCKDYSDSTREDYYIDFPERIQNVRNISVESVEFPSLYYNFSRNFENTSFIIDISTNTMKDSFAIDISDGFYDVYTINQAINSNIINDISLSNYNIESLTFNQNIDKYNTDISMSLVYPLITNLPTVSIYFATKTDCNGVVEKNNDILQSRLGWKLGFRKPSYILNKNKLLITSESFLDIAGPRYFFLAIDEFNNSAPQSSFISMLPKSLINKNIIARMTTNVFSDIGSLVSNSYNINNGYLCSDTRQYSDDIDIQKMHIQLLDEFGRTISLNEMNFSFLLRVEHT